MIPFFLYLIVSQMSYASNIVIRETITPEKIQTDYLSQNRQEGPLNLGPLVPSYMINNI